MTSPYLPSGRAGALVIGLLALLAGCRRVSPAASPPVAAPSPDSGSDLGPMERALPAIAGAFRAEPVARHDGFVRRAYVRGATRIEITIAYRPQRGDEYQQWVAAAREYPVATLDLPPSEALGFFTCGDPAGRTGCDLHVQLRAGYHVEVMSNGTATRGDLEELMVAVPLGALVGPR